MTLLINISHNYIPKPWKFYFLVQLNFFFHSLNLIDFLFFQILKNNLPAENQSPHEIWKGTNENNWIGSSVSVNSPVKLEPNVSRYSIAGNVPAEILHSNQHWSVQNSEMMNTPVSQPASVHSIRLVTKPLTIPSNLLIKTSSGEVTQGKLIYSFLYRVFWYKLIEHLNNSNLEKLKKANIKSSEWRIKAIFLHCSHLIIE